MVCEIIYNYFILQFNSNYYKTLFFSAGIFRETFTSLTHISPGVLYPIPNFQALDQPSESDSEIIPPNKKIIFLSINRYERKKNLNLAVESFGMYKYM